MRKFTLPALSLYIDFLFVNAAVILLAFFLVEAIEHLLGRPWTWAAEMSASLLLLIALRLCNLSLGERLLNYANAERQSGGTARQWPNLLLGTVGVLSGLKEMVRWTLPGDGMPVLFMVEETPAKVLAVFTFGLLYLAGGILLLTFSRGAKVFNAAFLALGTGMMAVNLLYFRDDMVRAQIDRRINQGLPADPDAAEAVIATAPIYGAAFFAILFLILFFCRERPGAAFAVQR